MHKGNRILITGFTSYLTHTENPSEKIATILSEISSFRKRIVCVILPASYRACAEFVDSFHWENISCVVSMGLNPKCKFPQIERIAINLEDAKESDSDGVVAHDRKIALDGLDGIFSRLPIGRILAALVDKGFVAEISNSAGSYICNALFYQVMQKSLELGFPAGFIHLPKPQSEDELMRLVRLIECVIQTILELS
jgi:pyroglutamyl-peptidase